MNSNDELKYLDLQVNGYAGIDFNNLNLSSEQLHYACKKLIKDQVEGIFATLITDDFDRMINKIKNLVSLIDQDDFVKSVIKGIHIEGPFLNSEDGYRGAHPKEYIISPNLDKAKQILDAGNGLIKIFTLAPENDSNFKVIKYLSENKIVVSAGHSNASLKHLLGGIDNGLKMFTHLSNGAPNILPRHDNIINRVLSLSDKLFICFIADGIHIPDFVLQNYLNVAGIDKCIIVTDAMAAASAPPGRYSISHLEVEVKEDKVVREVGKDNLAGSAITLKASEKFLIEKLRLSTAETELMMFQNPKEVLGLI